MIFWTALESMQKTLNGSLQKFVFYITNYDKLYLLLFHHFIIILVLQLLV